MAVDDLGNFDPTPVTTRFTVDTTRPDTKLEGPLKRVVRSKSVQVRFDASEPTSYFTCALDRLGPKPCKSPVKLRKLAPGNHTLTVRAYDLLEQGDDSPAEYAFRVAGR